MAGRLMLLRSSRSLRYSLISSTLKSDAPAATPLNSPSIRFQNSAPFSASGGDSLGNLFRSKTLSCTRQMSSFVSKFPDISDPGIKTAINRLYATSWLEIEGETKDAIEAALAKTSTDKAGYTALLNSWHAALAVEKFSDGLFALKMELDDLSGAGGGKVGKIPEALFDALQAALNRYTKYLSLFEEDETFLKRKVETELGGVLIHIKQRCSGLDANWGEISLLGTSGLSGSYIERRH